MLRRQGTLMVGSNFFVVFHQIERVRRLQMQSAGRKMDDGKLTLIDCKSLPRTTDRNLTPRSFCRFRAARHMNERPKIMKDSAMTISKFLLTVNYILGDQKG
jgi:hypothetical protein